MATTATFFNKLFSLLILILHLGCFIFTTTTIHKPPSKKCKISPSSHPKFKTHKTLSSPWTLIKHLFSKPCKTANTTTHPSPQSSTTTTTTTTATQQSLASVMNPDPNFPDPIPGSFPEPDISANNNAIFPCTECGEIFQKPPTLEQHRATKHVLSELAETDAGHNIVRLIFESGWSESEKRPEINRILKIHNGPKILSRFEEYRENVKTQAALNGVVRKRNDERCIADGNELMRFHCSTFLCDLGHNGDSAICSRQFCNICGIIESGFSPKLDGISTLSTAWRAHVSVPDELEREFGFMNVKRAMLLCRVVAGRVGCNFEEGFDSVVAHAGSRACTRSDEEELLVFNPRAVLPCFVIVYSL